MKAAPDLKSDPLSLDSITLEVIRHGIVSITDQIDANIARTAFSRTFTKTRILPSGW